MKPFHRKRKSTPMWFLLLTLALLLFMSFRKVSYVAGVSITWSFTIVDSSETVGVFTSLALDASGNAHISYHDYLNGDLKYAHQNASGWHIITVDTVGNVGLHTSLALDASGYAHISYHDSTNSDLKYAHQNASGWYITTLDSTGYVGWETSLALDASGYAHISYYDTSHGDLKYAHQNASGWYITTVDSAGTTGRYTSLALDASGYAHISYYDSANRDLKYAHQNASGWYTITVDRTWETGQYTSLALDASGYAHISYYYSTYGDLKYAHQNVSGWYTTTVDSTGDVGQYTSLALDASGYAHISYYDGLPNSDLKYVYQNASGWHITTVDSWSSVGRYTSLALDTSGYVHISYFAGGPHDLKYTRSYPPIVSNAPILLSPVDGVILTDASPLLEWIEIGNAAYYVVQVDDELSFTWPWLVYINAFTNSNELSILPNGSFYWRVHAVDAEGNVSPWSLSWSFTIAADVPILISPPDRTVLTDNTPLLNWTEVNDTVEYVIQIDDAVFFNIPRVLDVNVTTSSYETLPLAVGTYYWRVRAVDSKSESSPWSLVWSFSIREATTSSETTSSETSPGFGTISSISLVLAMVLFRFMCRKRFTS